MPLPFPCPSLSFPFTSLHIPSLSFPPLTITFPLSLSSLPLPSLTSPLFLLILLLLLLLLHLLTLTLRWPYPPIPLPLLNSTVIHYRSGHGIPARNMRYGHVRGAMQSWDAVSTVRQAHMHPVQSGDTSIIPHSATNTTVAGGAIQCSTIVYNRNHTQ